MRRKPVLVLAFALITASSHAHEVDLSVPVVIDTDMGIDDAVMLAAALQAPHLRIVACVATDGVLAGDTAVAMVGRMLDEFNRSDVALYGPPPEQTPRTAPPFRASAGKWVSSALRSRSPVAPRPFAPAAYRAPHGRKTLVLVAGPLTSLAQAIQEESTRANITRVLVQGPPDPETNWNIRRDPDAFKQVVRSGIRLEFVSAGAVAKPPAWQEASHLFGQQTSVGESFVLRLLGQQDVRQHYAAGALRQFTDELLVLCAVDRDLFEPISRSPGHPACLQPRDSSAIANLLTQMLSEGRQVKNRVVFEPGPLPDDLLQPDLRSRKAAIVGKNGPTEWFAQLLMNELHEHLGAYSIIGVKMGLRAAELLNAPQHGMQVVSHSGPRPPVSCLNDGVIVATGSTPGRGLFRHEPAAAGTRVAFTYNGRRVELALKEEYQRKIQAAIGELLEEHTLEDEDYWSGVRSFSLDIWEQWHRRDLFEMTPTAAGD